MSYLAIVKAAEARLRAERDQAATPSAEVIDRLLTMPLDQYEREGDPIEIKVSWFTQTVWFVPTERDAETLMKEGVSRGRIWTAKELSDLLAIPGLTKERVKQMATAKRMFEGTVHESGQ